MRHPPRKPHYEDRKTNFRNFKLSLCAKENKRKGSFIFKLRLSSLLPSGMEALCVPLLASHSVSRNIYITAVQCVTSLSRHRAGFEMRGPCSLILVGWDKSVQCLDSFDINLPERRPQSEFAVKSN